VLTEGTLVDGLALTPEQVEAVKSLKARLSLPPDSTGESDGDELASPGEG
jgi:hypothetical protein